MEAILAQARQIAEHAEVFMVSEEETPVQFETNRLKHIHSKQGTSVTLRVIKEGRIGCATATGLADRQALVNMAVETARYGMKAQFELPALTSYPRVEIYDPGVESVSLETMASLGERLIAEVRRDTPELICEAGVARATVSVRIMNSRGGQADYRETVFSLGIEGQLIRDTDMLFVGESQSSCHPLLDPDTVAREVVQQLERARNQASAPTGSLPVVFTPHGVATALAMPLMAAFNGKTVLEGASPIGSRLGQLVFSEKFSLWDDPTIDYQPGSRPCDDEGVPSQRTPLIERGVVASFLYDLQTAALAHTRSTGSGRRGRGGLPAPSPSALIVAPGEATFDEMVRDIKEGLVVEQLMGATQGNILGGDFSGNVLLGYKVENGKIVGRVKNTMVAGNIYQLLNQDIVLGSEARWVGGFLNTPPIFIPSVSVASK